MTARRSRNFRGSSRRLTQWFRSTDIAAPVSLAAATAVIDQTLQGITEPVTVVRCRGSMWMRSDQIAASESPFGAVGMAVVTDQAVAAGVASVPTPISDKDSDSWIMHQYFANGLLFGDATGFASPSFTRVDFDSKAMRKIPEGSTLSWMVENASAADGLLYILQFAVLIKLA